jgi:hypothetical protein
MDAMLAGLVLPNVQNHSLARLAGAAAARGFSADVVPFRGFPDIDPIADRVRALAPRLFGLSIQTTEAALASATLLEVLRRRGYRGMVVVGGHFATLNTEELLRDVPAIDAVVRFAGEEALVALLRDGLDPDALARAPGLAFRDAEREGRVRFGAPPVIEAPGETCAGDRGPLPFHLGFGAADLVASRGCEAHCAYCCVAGASDLAERAGGPRAARRGPDAVAADVAALFHERDARVFNFMDDNLLPQAPADALAFLRALERGLAARAVGRIALSLQLRADVCTAEVVAALVGLGLCRAYVGIDGYSGRQLVALGRDAPAEAGFEALGRLGAAGVFSVANALLIGPTFAFETIQREVEGLARVREAPVHLLPIDVRAGSTYFERVRKRGLLEGGLLWRRYRFADPRTALLAEALTAFPSRLEEYSVPIALYDLGYNLGVARRLVPRADTDPAVETYRRVTARWNADQVRVLRGALAAAARGARDDVTRFVDGERERVRALDAELGAACAAALRAVERAVGAAGHPSAQAHARGQLLATVALSMALVSCGRRPSIGPRDGAASEPAALVADAATDAADAADGPGDERAPPPCGADHPDAGTSAGVPGQVCCASPTAPGGGNVLVTFDDHGNPTTVALPDGGDAATDTRDCVLRWLRNYCYPSLAGTTQPIANGHCWVA